MRKVAGVIKGVDWDAAGDTAVLLGLVISTALFPAVIYFVLLYILGV